MLENYSFKISRNDAKTKILGNEEIYKNKEFKEKFQKFIKAWNEIKNDAKKYQCRPEMDIKNLSEKDKLIFFLIDNGEIGGGMYLASACQNFISWQNSFLQPIIDSKTLILNSYIDNIKQKVPLQEAKSKQILLINERFANSKYKNFQDVINTFSERNIFSQNGKINYSDYNSFLYDYDAIEEELGKIILPGVCLFESEENLNFVAFWFEGFRGGRSQVLSQFYTNYPQKSLNKKEKEIIVKYIKEINKNNYNYDFNEFFSSLQIIIFYLNEKGIININETISNIIKKSSGILKLSEDCANFFLKEGNQLTIDKIMDIFLLIEHLCFEDLKKTIQNEYKKIKISDDIKAKIKNKLLENEKNPEKLYSIKDLGAAVRRFISRYLAGSREDVDVKPERELTFELTRNDLWEEKIVNDQNFENTINNQLKEFNLTVGHAYDLYELIGDEDKKSIQNEKNIEKNM